ncbi:hypothetical protein L596_000003 [Steinernema carpocapsae]|uniref:Uncharacterized protein n=1 Tax=Steinernema carpocapsae TaxID=34508 RepID=A0A4U8UKY9_STECR|nr:hypothetical protein L596_000003 [Steinernema carpocapsae]
MSTRMSPNTGHTFRSHVWLHISTSTERILLIFSSFDASLGDLSFATRKKNRCLPKPKPKLAWPEATPKPKPKNRGTILTTPIVFPSPRTPKTTFTLNLDIPLKAYPEMSTRMSPNTGHTFRSHVWPNISTSTERILLIFGSFDASPR